jgi:ankyrin repeat protein
MLINGGAKLNAQNDNGKSPLHLAAFWGHYDVIKLLVEAGASLDLKTEKGRTGLDISALYGHQQIAEYLSKKSGKPIPESKKSKSRKTSEMQAPSDSPGK